MASDAPNSENMQEDKDNPASVGALLQASRLRLGDDLRYVAETLHIRYIYLEAIEGGRFDELPGAAYAIGFIRTYADYLGLDSEEVVRRYKAESALKTVDTDLVFPVPIPESSIPGGAIVFVGVVVALLAYGGWYVSTAKDGFLAGLVSPVPERLSEDTEAAEPEMKAEATPPVEEQPAAAAPQPTMTEEATQAVEEGSQEVTEKVEEAAETATEATQETAAEVTQEAESVVESAPAAAEELKEEVEQEAAVETTETAAAVESATETVEEAASETVETVEETAESAGSDASTEVAETAEEVEEAVQETVEEATTPAQQPAETPSVSSEPVLAGDDEEVLDEGEGDVAESEPAPEPEPEPEPEITAETTTETQTASAPVETGRVYGEDNENSRITVKARKNSWIQVRDHNANRLVLTQLLRSGDSYRVPNQEGLVLLTGNAGALEILVDGEPVPDLGAAGKVRRNVALDPELLRQGAAAE